MTEYTFNKLLEKGKLPKTCCSTCAHKLASRTRDKETIYKKVSDTLQLHYLNKEDTVKNKIRICRVCGNLYKYIRETGATKSCCSKICSNYLKSNIGKFDSEETKKKRHEGAIKAVNSLARRSKNEIYFCEMCASHFNNVEHNVPLFNGWDADVIIHDIKYAVLWNGIWHYKQISKKLSLSQILTRDKIKIEEIIKFGYTPYVIKDMGSYDKIFVNEQFEIFINYLLQLLLV